MALQLLCSFRIRPLEAQSGSEFLVRSNDTGKPKATLQQKISLRTLGKKSSTQGRTNPNILQKQLGRKRSSSVSVFGNRSH